MSKTIADIFLGLASPIAILLGKPETLRRARSQDAGELFEKVAVCLEGIVDKYEKNIEPAGECAELFVYSQQLPNIVRKLAGFWGNREVKRWANELEIATDAPSSLITDMKYKSTLTWGISPSPKGEKDTETDIESEIRKLREVAGHFRGAANMIKVGARGKNFS